MNSRDVVRRIRAFAAGRPIPRGSTVHFPVAEGSDALVVAFVRMGGETAPWGIAYASGRAAPTVLSVPEPRDRTLVADMVLDFGRVLLRHISHPRFDEGPYDRDRLPPLRQIWVPSRTHLEMLHFLAYSYRRTRYGEGERQETLQAVGRAGAWLFHLAQHPSQVLVMDATAALKESYTFPADDVRQAHLGFLLAWLETRGDLRQRFAAATLAESRAVATTMSPAIERENLVSAVTDWREAGKQGPRAEDAAGAIGRVLREELLRRVELTRRAIGFIAQDPRPWNEGLDTLEQDTRSQHWWGYRRHEDLGQGHLLPHPETDFGASIAAARFHEVEASHDTKWAALIHDDDEMLEDTIAKGDAFRGVIDSVRDDGHGRTKIPVWTITTTAVGPLRMRVGSAAAVWGLPSRKGRILRIDDAGEDNLEIEIEITALKTRPRDPNLNVRLATDGALVDTDVAFVPVVDPYMNQKRRSLVWANDGPGGWLTHGDRNPDE